MLLLLTAGYVKAQSVDELLAAAGDPYPGLYNYSTMPDTLIRQVGNYLLANGQFQVKQNPQEFCCAAVRTIRVKSGKLKEVTITDTGTGYMVTRKYKKGKLVKEKRKFDVKIVRNVPPYH